MISSTQLQTTTLKIEDTKLAHTKKSIQTVEFVFHKLYFD